MKHKTSLFAALLLIVALSLIYVDVSKKQASLLQDMAVLDRAYIPALFYSAEGEQNKSRKAMAKFIRGWEAFKKNNIDMGKFDPYWDEDLDKVENLIHRADSLIKDGNDLVAAHDELEKIRDVMLELRVRNSMDYFLDYMTRFHSSMEAILLTVKDKPAETLSEQDLEIVEQELKKAELLWQDVMSAKVDGKLFGFNKAQLKSVETLKLEQRDKIEQLQQVLAAGDKSAIIKSSLALRPVFARLFKMFGDFTSLT